MHRLPADNIGPTVGAMAWTAEALSAPDACFTALVHLLEQPQQLHTKHGSKWWNSDLDSIGQLRRAETLCVPFACCCVTVGRC
jgi:hypothetical protein